LLHAITLVANPDFLSFVLHHLHLLIGALSAVYLLAHAAMMLTVQEAELAKAVLTVVNILVGHPLLVLKRLV
jgi:ABC-type proline/glycine betaine transport system permease subunit